MDEFLFLFVGIFIGFLLGMVIFMFMTIKDHEADKIWYEGYRMGKGVAGNGTLYTDDESGSGKGSQARG